jgi:4-diphosphocytidyl-2-C-methyl-D-erythritol kinase
MAKIVSHALAKVNLMLNITGKAVNGYHEMESIFVFLRDVFDVLIFDTSDTFNEKFVNIDDIEHEENSIIKASRILIKHFQITLPKVVLCKKLPIGGGLGGGSSDSACFINSIFDILKFSRTKKLEYIDMFDSLGADNKVFLYKYFTNSKTIYMHGTGLNGVITGITFNAIKGNYILIVNNGILLKTKYVFDKFHEPFSAKIGSENINTLFNFNNSLQVSVIELENSLEHVIASIKETKPLFCGVSGSGSSCFGIYTDLKAAKFAKKSLSKYRFVKISRV